MSVHLFQSLNAIVIACGNQKSNSSSLHIYVYDKIQVALAPHHCTCVKGLSTTNAQFSMSNYGSMDQLTRIPGYHPAIAYPGSRTPDLPQQSRDSDSYTRTSSDTCPEVNRDCSRDCRRLDERKCRVCRCHGNIDIKSKT